jgi:hypothetical protein
MIITKIKIATDGHEHKWAYFAAPQPPYGNRNTKESIF